MPYVSSGYDFRPRHNMSYSPCVQYTKWLRPRIEASHTGACHKYWFRNTNIPKPICVTRAGALRISFALIYNIFLNYLKFMEPKKDRNVFHHFGSVRFRDYRYTEYRYTALLMGSKITGPPGRQILKDARPGQKVSALGTRAGAYFQHWYHIHMMYISSLIVKTWKPYEIPND